MRSLESFLDRNRDAQAWNIFQEGDAGFVPVPVFGDEPAHHDRVAIAHGQSGIGVAAVDDRDRVIVDEHVAPAGAELLARFP